MDNKLNTIIQNPFANLHKNHIELYYTLLNYERHNEINGFLEDDKGMILTNKFLAHAHSTTIKAISQGLNKLAKRGLVKLSYQPNGFGEIRKIYIVKEASQNGN